MSLVIVIPVRNEEVRLPAGLARLAARLQECGLEDYQVIVADNGSHDHTKAVADSFAGRFANFRYIYDARPGQMVGWHRALAVATGEITF